MYNHILDSLKQSNQINDIELYLQSLQPYVANLRRSYCSNHVSVNYSDPKIQAAYLLTYYPQYTEMTHKVLSDLTQNYFPANNIDFNGFQACFFCAGPAPEAIGWLKYLNHYYPSVRSTIVHTYDIAASTWERNQETTKYVASRLFPNLQLRLQAHNLNLCQNNALPSIRNIIQTSNLFFFQNCLNEFISNSEYLIKNIDFLIAEMPINSILIMADLNYSSTTDLLQRVESFVGSNSNKLRLIRSYSSQTINLRSSLMPSQFIKENLLTGANNLIPRRNINFNYLAIQKSSLSARLNYADIPF